MYLASLGAPSFDGGHILGLSEETTCYVSLEYSTQKDPFADYVVHEVARIESETGGGSCTGHLTG
jgi:hypothetical protein